MGVIFLSFFFSFFLFLICFRFVVFKEVCSVGLKEVYSILLDLKRVVCVGPKEVLFNSVGLKEIYFVGLKEVYSVGLKEVYSVGLKDVYSAGLKNIYSVGLKETYSVGLKEVYSVGLKDVYSAGLKDIYSV